MADSDEGVVQRLELAIAAAREAGALTLRYYQTDVTVDVKQDASPVTIADREAEQLLRTAIHAAFPRDGILGEEFGEQVGSSGYRWILDPIDGTKSFITGVPLYGTLIGVERGEECVLGVIHIPVLDECVWARTGGGAWYAKGDRPPQPTRVSTVQRLSDAVFLTSQVDGFARRGRGDVYERLQAVARVTRTWGDCYGYLLVATGRADVMVDPQMNAWDAAALLPVLVEAGGTYTDWQGRPTIHAGEGVATNRLLLDEVLSITRGT